MFYRRPGPICGDRLNTYGNEMRVIYCPPGQDPMQMAHAASKRAGGGLGENWWMLPTIIAFLVIGFTVGPLKGCIPDIKSGVSAEASVTATAPETVITPTVVQITPTPQQFCNLPMGGKIANGDTAWVDLEIKVVLYRCENGNLSEVESVNTAQVSP